MMGTEKDNYYAILMAGGVGSRFWPASKASNPKQFQDILGVGETLFQTTFKRLSRLIPSENIYILTNSRYVDIVKEQLPQIKEEQIVPEPEMRNTAPSILMGALKIYKKNPNSLIVVAPSDHWIKEEDRFIDAIQEAFDNVKNNDRLITLGVEPANPNTGYGYIKYNKEEKENIKKVDSFTEKPNKKKAKEFIDAGNYSWNAGIFIWSAKFIIENFKQYLPDTFEVLNKGQKNWNTAEEGKFIKDNYSKTTNISIDYGVMEKSDSVYVIPVSFDWSDLGTWSSLKTELPADDDENIAINCRFLSEESENNIVSTADKKIVVLKGLSDFIVVEDKEVLMIVPKSEEQGIKQLRDKVMKNFGEDLG